MTYKRTIPVAPMGAPRMTQRDKWQQRPRVMRYRQTKDAIRAACHDLPSEATHVSWIAFFEFPKSYSKKKRQTLKGALHQQKPDRDNIDKLILDALFEEDCEIASGTIEKRWDDGKGARIEIEIS